MNALFEFWPAVAAGAIGALVPRRPSAWERIGFGLIAAALVLFVMRMWPEAAAAALPAAPQGEWPHLLELLIALPLGGAVLICATSGWLLRNPASARFSCPVP